MDSERELVMIRDELLMVRCFTVEDRFTIYLYILIIYRVAQKVSHYQESSLHRIKKTISAATFLINFEYEMSRKMI